MTDNNDSNENPKKSSGQPSDQQPDVPQDAKHSKSTFDLRAAADEALRMLRDSQGNEDAVDPEQTNIMPLNRSDRAGSTTQYLSQSAYKAHPMQSGSSPEPPESFVDQVEFPESCLLRLELRDTAKPFILDVNGEMMIGRADNVTDYVPDVDLTAYGAYRLGLSRRHAVLLRINERLIVKDLNSRNGTYVNGKALEKGGTKELKSGDELRFGNLSMHLTFQKKTEDTPE